MEESCPSCGTVVGEHLPHCNAKYDPSTWKTSKSPDVNFEKLEEIEEEFWNDLARHLSDTRNKDIPM